MTETTWEVIETLNAKLAAAEAKLRDPIYLECCALREAAERKLKAIEQYCETSIGAGWTARADILAIVRKGEEE